MVGWCPVFESPFGLCVAASYPKENENKKTKKKTKENEKMRKTRKNGPLFSGPCRKQNANRGVALLLAMLSEHWRRYTKAASRAAPGFQTCKEPFLAP